MCHPLQRVLLPAVLSLTCCPLPHLSPSPEAHHRELPPHRFIFSFMDPCEYYAAHPPDSSQQPPLPFPSPTPTISFSSSLSSSLHQDSSGQETAKNTEEHENFHKRLYVFTARSRSRPLSLRWNFEETPEPATGPRSALTKVSGDT